MQFRQKLTVCCAEPLQWWSWSFLVNHHENTFHVCCKTAPCSPRGQSSHTVCKDGHSFVTGLTSKPRGNAFRLENAVFKSKSHHRFFSLAANIPGTVPFRNTAWECKFPLLLGAWCANQCVWLHIQHIGRFAISGFRQVLSNNHNLQILHSSLEREHLKLCFSCKVYRQPLNKPLLCV